MTEVLHLTDKQDIADRTDRTLAETAIPHREEAVLPVGARRHVIRGLTAVLLSALHVCPAIPKGMEEEAATAGSPEAPLRGRAIPPPVGAAI